MEKIAIIGLSCLFPDAQTPEQFWQNLIEEKDSTSLATAEQMGVDPAIFYDPVKGKADKTYYLQGGYIRGFSFVEDAPSKMPSGVLRGGDASGYYLPSEFLAGLDNLFKWSLHVAKGALQDSGYLGREAALTKCGLILGNLSFPTKASYQLVAPIYQQAIEPALQALLQEMDFRLVDLDPANKASFYNAMISGYPAAVVAQALGLTGISFSLDAACASSLYAVKLACQYLLSYKADLMLAGGVSCADNLFLSTGFSNFQAYPENGPSRPLDKSSGGLTTGQGAGMLALKRYSDAIRDGDQIYATICGIGLSNDGRGKHPLTPNPTGQILAFERAYASANIDPKTVDYVECHATGTPVGDITELNSMEAFFSQHGAAPLVGSVKSNLGHLLTAAGMAGMIKVILSMARELIPATIHIVDPLCSQNNTITAKQIVSRKMPWPQKPGAKRAGVSAFGFGGTNAHLILEYPGGHRQEERSRREEKESTKWFSVHGSAFNPEPRTQNPEPGTRQPRVAIVGMGAFFGSSRDLDAFERTIYDGRQHFIPIPTHRWKGVENQSQLLKDYGFAIGTSPKGEGEAPEGAYIENFEIDALYAKIPPNEADKLNPQQLLLLKVADNALRDARLTEGGNVAVIIAMGTELSLHRPLARYHLSWQIKESLARANIALPPEEVAELERIVKESVHHTIQTNEYVSMIGNIMASRISTLWNFSGPSFTLSAEENSVFKALEVAQMLLATEEVDAVVVGAVDLAGGVENVLLRNQIAAVNTGGKTMSYDQNSNGWLVGEGAGAVVLKRYDRAKSEQARIYAVIDAISIIQEQPKAAESDTLPLRPSVETVRRACQLAFAETGITPGNIGYLEVFGSGVSWEDEAEIKGLLQAYQPATPILPHSPTPPERGTGDLSCAIGSVKANIGHTYAASGIASLIKTALCLHHRYIPATPGWSAPKMLALWQGSPFYVATESRPWILEEGVSKRIAAINGLGQDGACAHIILSEDPYAPHPPLGGRDISQTKRTNKYLAQAPFYLLPITGDDQSDLLEQLNVLRQQIENDVPLSNIARQHLVAYQSTPPSGGPGGAYVLALVGRNKNELSREIQLALQGVPRAFDQQGDWKTPLGSYFTANPLGQQGTVSLVYPGAFNAFVGLARDLFHLFPEIYDKAVDLSNDTTLGVEKFVYPRSLSKLSPRQLEAYEAQLARDITVMLKAGTIAAWQFTAILRDCFDLKPKTAFGYSLGDFSMIFALGIWTSVRQTYDDLHASPLFHTRLSGPKETVREYWGLSPHTPEGTGSTGEVFWSTYVLLTSTSRVIESLKNEERVYLTHINAPGEVVIAGDREGCLRVIKSLKCDAFRAPFNDVLHCEVMDSEYDEFVNLFTLPIQSDPEITLYSAADYGPIPLESQAIAHSIARALCKPLNFPELINRVYQDGARIFIEPGPGATCSRWIHETLKDKPHVTVSMNQRGVDDHTAILKALAKLLSHHVPLNLSPLYGQTSSSSRSGNAIIKTVTLGGSRIKDTILSKMPRSGGVKKENKQRFKSWNVPEGGKQPQFATSLLYQYPPSAGHRKTSENKSVTAQTHITFLKTRLDALQQLSQIIQLQISVSRQLLDRLPDPGQGPPPPLAPIPRIPPLSGAHGAQVYSQPPSQTDTPDTPHPPLAPTSSPPLGGTEGGRGADSHIRRPDVIFTEADILEFANGKIANVFGQEYALIDTYPRRVRLPGPPYLFVSRVTRLEAERGRYERCSIETEYDIPHNAWYTIDGQIPGTVAIEASHANMLLVSYLGIDFENQGQQVYRALDGHVTFLDKLPQVGDTLRCHVTIDSFARSGDTRIFFYTYECFVRDSILLKMKGIAGFFTDEALEKAKGISASKATEVANGNIQKKYFESPLTCHKLAFDEVDLTRLSEGDIAACFGQQYQQNGGNRSLRLPPSAVRMIDRVTSIDPRGGAWGLGLVYGEKTLDPGAWYFNCHFKDDLCIPGTLVGEGCVQLLQFYLLFLGLQTHTTDARFQPKPDLKLAGHSRGQIRPTSGVLTYRLEVTDIGLSPQPYATANVDVIFAGKVVARCKDLGMQLSEK